MKATGIVRRIDDLGRVVIPKEIRRTLRIKEGDPLEIFTDRDGEVIFKKYSPIGELGEFASDYAESLSKTSGYPVCITDKDSIIAVSGASKKELSEKPVSSDLEKIMDEKVPYVVSQSDGKQLYIAQGNDKYQMGVAVPIISEGDCLGSVVVVSNEKGIPGEVETKLAQTAANFLGRHMEN
ncbi:MAG: stage V sporulation protein T [Clostridia bacterium]|nr:stage V sporulation protein T [Clostridia bacterium]